MLAAKELVWVRSSIARVRSTRLATKLSCSRDDFSPIEALGKLQRITFDDLENIGAVTVGREGRPVEQVAGELNNFTLTSGAGEEKLNLAAASSTEN